jgi:hypothetical protein
MFRPQSRQGHLVRRRRERRVATSVIAMAVARLILDPFGL